MPKSIKQNKTRATPYNKPIKTQNKTQTPLKKKPISKSEKIRNADLTDKLDTLIDGLSSELKTKKNKKDKVTLENEKIVKQKQLELEQQLYEKTQNDLDDALGLLTKL